MKSHLSSLLIATATLLVSGPVHAQSAAEDVPPVPGPAAPAAAVEPTNAELQQQIKALQDALTRNENDAMLAHERETAERERLVRIYGFADVGGKYTTTPEDSIYASRFASPATFFLGRLNLYFDSHPAEDFRFLAETRFSLYPNGSSAGVDSSYQVIRTSTTVSDIASPNPQMNESWGGVILERAVLDWTRYPWLSVRAGLFLSPFGIYTVDHGTPTLISIALPLYLSLGWIPERQLGLQIYGSLPMDRWEFGYAATVGNGRSSGAVDVSNAKTFGGRLFARRQGALRLQLGVSAVYQPWRQYREQFGIDATSGAFTYAKTLQVESNSTTVGGDLSLDYGGLRIRSELVWYQLEYAAGKRDVGANTLTGLNPDERDLNWSLILAYRYWVIEPYLLSEIFHCSPTEYLGTNVWVPGAGVNVYLRPNVILKGAWFGPHFYKNDDPDKLAARRNFNTYSLLLTWAF